MKYLFKEKRIVCNGISTIPHKSKQNEFLDSPFIMDAYSLAIGI
jgi:hypothetical protein